jgi:hypothetical protein
MAMDSHFFGDGVRCCERRIPLPPPTFAITHWSATTTVYHVPSTAGLLYVKFTADVVTAFLLLSFKEKDND